MLQFPDITGQHQEYATSQQIGDKNRCFQNTYGEWTLINTWLANPPPRILQETEFLAIIQGPYHLSTSFDIIQLRESLHLPIKIRSSPPEIRVDFLNPLSNPSNPPFPPCLFFFGFFCRKKQWFLWFPRLFLLDASREIFQLPQVRCHLCHFRQYALRHLGAARRRKVALSKKEEKTGVFTEYKYNDTPNCVYINKLIVHIIVLKIHFQQTMTITKKIYTKIMFICSLNTQDSTIVDLRRLQERIFQHTKIDCHPLLPLSASGKPESQWLGCS